MKVVQAVVALTAVGLGLLVTWSFFSGLPAGESSPFAYLMIPAMFVGVLPTILGLVVGMAALMAERSYSLFLRMTSPGALTRLRGRTRKGFFVVGLVSAVMGLAVSCFCTASRSTSYLDGDWRSIFFSISWLLVPAVFGGVVCVALMAAGKTASGPRERWNRDGE